MPVGAKAKWGVEDTWGGCCLWDSGKLGAAHCTWGGKGFRLYLSGHSRCVWGECVLLAEGSPGQGEASLSTLRRHLSGTLFSPGSP